MARFIGLATALGLLAAQEYPKLAPFSGLRWNGDEPVVEVSGTWIALDSIAGTPAREIVEFCKKTWPEKWRQRFGEDLVEAMSLMGKAPGESVDLKGRESSTGKERVFPAVAMTRENRQAIWGAKAGGPLTKEFVEEDLDQLRQHLQERFAYLSVKGYEWNKALIELEARIPDAPTKIWLVLELMRFMSRFGDGHSGVEEDPQTAPGFARFLVGDVGGGKFVAFHPDRSSLFNPEFPYVRSMDGKPIEEWLKVASKFVSAGSPAYVRHHSARLLRNIPFLRSEMKLAASPTVKVELGGESGTTQHTEMPLWPKRPMYGSWPAGESRLIDGDIGYLRIPEMTGDAAALRELVKTFEGFKETKGLIIDVRGNGGGTRDILQALFPYFMRASDPMHIANVAAFRLPPDVSPALEEGYLDDRDLYPVTSKAWSPEEKAALQKFAKSFRAEWSPPAGKFSAWHYFGLRRGEPAFYYSRPAIILMDTGCFSATDIFLGAFKGWRNVTLMGTPSGGGSGRAKAVVLNRSKITLRLSTMTSFRRDGSLYDGKGVAPDVEIYPKASDFLKDGGDSVLDAAVQRLKKK